MKEFNNIKDIIWKHKPSEEENMFAKREKWLPSCDFLE